MAICNAFMWKTMTADAWLPGERRRNMTKQSLHASWAARGRWDYQLSNDVALSSEAFRKLPIGKGAKQNTMASLGSPGSTCVLAVHPFDLSGTVCMHKRVASVAFNDCVECVPATQLLGH